jgi:hypothetical protein
VKVVYVERVRVSFEGLIGGVFQAPASEALNDLF